MLLFLSVVTATDQVAEQCPVIDEALFPLIGNGDIKAFELLYRQSERAVYAFVLSILRNPDATCDIVQDTYVRVRSAAHLYKPQGKPLAWLFTIARNLCYNSKRQTAMISFDEYNLENDRIFSCVSDYEDRIVLTEALKILNELERKVIFLHLVSGLTHKEISLSMNQPLSTVLSRYNRALRKLKKHLLEQEVFEEWRTK
ncbi:MAG: RNA polymerase sigma factor [Oscillospiraceae bacterium]|nr:RNA polymerase sigma factor [Oscillospiraceae bacterium]